MLAIRLRCKNDTNGNPRRVYVIFDKGRMIDAIDEGYSGRQALLGKYPALDSAIVEDIETTPATRRELLKRFSK